MILFCSFSLGRILKEKKANSANNSFEPFLRHITNNDIAKRKRVYP